MEETKKWYESKAVLSGIVTVVAIALAYFGYDLGTEAQAELVEKILLAVGGISSLIGIWGRIKATKKIGS